MSDVPEMVLLSELLCFLDFFENSGGEIKKPLFKAVFELYGGDDGSRTRVQKSLSQTFYKLIAFAEFPSSPRKCARHKREVAS